MRSLNDTGVFRHQALIDGVFVGSGDIEVRNPANGERLAAVPNFGAGEAGSAVAAAARAFPAWSARTAKDRAAILRRWFELMVANRHDLAVILTSEQGKPLLEALGEIDYAASYVGF